LNHSVIESMLEFAIAKWLNDSMTQSSQPNVAIAGGGLAGLAAGCALADAGFRVTLSEKRSFLGGRASSWEHPGTGEVVDNCQHVLLGCCTNLIEFYRRTGVDDKIRWYDELVFLEPGGRASVIAPSFLPAPLHTAPAFLQAYCLAWRDKLAIGWAMTMLASVFPDGTQPLLTRAQGKTIVRDTGESFLAWLKRRGQTPRAIDRFWKTILVSALNEDLDRISVPYAAQVIRESFLKSAAAGRMGVPTVPLTELYNAAGDYIRARGGTLRFRTSLEYLAPGESRVTVRTMNRANERPGTTADVFDYIISALPFDVLDRILLDTPESAPLREQLAHFETSPITGIHLWFDRQISDLDHAVLLDRTIQWMFHKSRLQPMRTQAGEQLTSAAEAAAENTPLNAALKRCATQNQSLIAGSEVSGIGSYIELVVSSSKSLVTSRARRSWIWPSGRCVNSSPLRGKRNW